MGLAVLASSRSRAVLGVQAVRLCPVRSVDLARTTNPFADHIVASLRSAAGEDLRGGVLAHGHLLVLFLLCWFSALWQ